MAKFVPMDQAAEKLGIPTERLNALREAGKIRAFRDGKSWKFGADEIEKLQTNGIPPLEEPGDSDLALDFSGLNNLDASGSALDLDLIEEPTDELAALSDISLEEIDEPTVPADLSEADLSQTTPDAKAKPAETADPSGIDLELDLSLSENDNLLAGMSDVSLATDPSDIASSDIHNENALTSGASGKFDDLDELEIDLEAESSRILTETDLAAAQAAAAAAEKSNAAKKKLAESSDLELDSQPADLSLDPSDSLTGLTGISALNLSSESASGLSGLSALELADDEDDDMVLGGDSDISLSTADSGINLGSPMDSGLALEALGSDLGGSPVGSSLDLPSVSAEDSGFALDALDDSDNAMVAGGSDAFSLSGVAELSGIEAAGSDPFGEAPQFNLDEPSSDSDGGFDSMDLGMATAGGIGMATMATEVVSGSGSSNDISFDKATTALLSLGFIMMLLCGIISIDLIRNMWSWQSTSEITSSFMSMFIS